MRRVAALVAVVALAIPAGAAKKPKPRTEGLRIYAVPTDSMRPLLESGDRVLVDEEAYVVVAPSRGDVVVYRSPDAEGGTLLKRIVGVPGDTVEFRDGKLFINGAAAIEAYEQPGTVVTTTSTTTATSTAAATSTATAVTSTAATTTAPAPGTIAPWHGTTAPVKLGDAEYYVVADNRAAPIVNDSRTHGPVARGMIHGRVLRYSHAGVVREIR